MKAFPWSLMVWWGVGHRIKWPFLVRIECTPGLFTESFELHPGCGYKVRVVSWGRHYWEPLSGDCVAEPATVAAAGPLSCLRRGAADSATILIRNIIWFKSNQDMFWRSNEKLCRHTSEYWEISIYVQIYAQYVQYMQKYHDDAEYIQKYAAGCIYSQKQKYAAKKYFYDICKYIHDICRNIRRLYKI